MIPPCIPRSRPGRSSASAAHSPKPAAHGSKLVQTCCLAVAGLGLTLDAGLRPALADTFPPSLTSPGRALLDGRADEATKLLQNVLTTDPGQGPAHLLLCRVYLSEERGREAAGECQTALQDGLEGNSAAQDWTGRALGQQAAHAGLLSGLKLALAVRTAFETAVDLDANSEAACVDLGEFYTSAPPVVGGGTGRARALAARIERTQPQTAHRILAMAAEKDKDYTTAEREFQAEVAVAQRPGAMVDLAAFYGRRGPTSKAVATAQQTIAADRAVDATVVEAAGVLMDAGQPAAAMAALEAYLAHGTRSDQAPACRVLTMLGTLLAKAGQRDAAKAQFQAALALAAGYPPAQRGLASL